MLQDRKTVRKLRDALDQHTSPNPKAAKPRSFPRLSANDDERKFERFVRAIRQCNNLSDARRFRNEVASQLKRESMMDDQDQVYLRRLETGKNLLDQRVGKLGAVGGISLSRPPQPDFRNGHTGSQLVYTSITEILRDASGLSYFMEYMDRQKLLTLVEFWIVVEGFRNPLEEDIVADDSFSTSRPKWNDADRTDLAQIYEAYLLKPELKVSEQSRDIVKNFLQSGKNATMSEYLTARSVVLMAQSADLELMREIHFPNFKRSDLYYKFLTSDESSKSTSKPPAKASKIPSVDSIPESPAKFPPIPRFNARSNTSALTLRRNASSNNDLTSSVKVSEPISHSQPRRSLEGDRPAPLFDDEFGNEVLSRSTQSIGSDSLNTERDYADREQMVEAMEAALNDIITGEKKDEESAEPLFEPFETTISPPKQADSPRSSEDFVRLEASSNDKDRGRPNLASLGLVNTASRIGVFSDNDLFDDEEKFIEDEHADPEASLDEKCLDDEIHQAAPGDLGLAEAISALSADIERLVAQESVVDTLTRKAELTNNGAELRILGKSRSSLQREIRRKELQRQQYIVQESDNSLFGRANVEIKSLMVGKDADGPEFALYVIEVQRKAGENMSAASWAVARRYSEFHDLHQRLRSIYPAVRHLDFPRRRLVMKLQREFLHKRRVSLQNYLKELLRLPAVCSSRDLRAFLSQQAIISYPDAGRAGERRDIVSRIYNSVTDGMDEFLGNLPVLDQLSIAGQNLISAATSQFNTMTTTGSVSEEDNSIQSAEAHAELLAFENRDIEPFVKPICDLFLEIFELNRDHNWLRGRAVVVVLHQLLGGTVERKVREAAQALIAEGSVLKYIGLTKNILWPDGGPLRRDSVIRTAAQRKHSKREASVMLATLMPDLAGHVVGRANAQAASRRVFATVNNQRLNTHLTFTVLDEVIGVLFPEERGVL
jgi:sorting nexin-25